MPALVISCAALGLAGCGDDGGGDSGGAGSTTNNNASTTQDPPPATTNDSVDTTAGPPGTTDEPQTTGVDTTAGDTEEPPPGGAIAFRINSIGLTDPFTRLFGSCTDNNGIVDGLLNDSITMDSDGDGNLDAGYIFPFESLTQTDGATGNTGFANGVCVAPDGATCSPQAGTSTFETTYLFMGTGVCLEPDPNVTDTGLAETTEGPCFVAGPVDVAIVSTNFTLPLTGAQLAARPVGDPAGNLVSGTMSGYLSREDAENTMLETKALSGPLAEFLCDAHQDGDGWWMHLSFTAVTTDWAG